MKPLSFSNLLEPVRLIRAEFSPYLWIIVLLIPVMGMKIVLESVIPLLLVPVFGEIGGDMLSVSGSDQLIWIDQWVKRLQAWLGLSSVLQTTFFLAVLIVVPKVIFTFLFFYLQFYVQYTYENNKRNELFEKLLRVKWTYYIRINSGQLMNTLHTETNYACRVFNGIVMLIDSLGMICFYLAIAIYISFVSTLFAILVLGLLLLILIPATQKAKRYGEALLSSRSSLMHHLNQLIHSFKVLKGSRMEEAGERFVRNVSTRCRHFYIRAGIIKNLPSMIFEPIIIVTLFGLVFAANRYAFVSLTEAGLVSFVLYRCMNKASILHKVWINAYEFVPSLKLMNELPVTYLQQEEERPSGTVEHIDGIQFREVSYQYPGGKIPALREIDLHIRQGDFVGVVGTSGSGKTTFVDSILSLLKPTAGQILVNGVDLNTIDPWQWRELIGYVPQESIMLNDTVKNNISLYREDIGQEDIEWAAAVASADEFIRELPHGYDTLVGERGARLSGGQRQRLVLARALVHKPQLLLLDEATSALDSFTEMKIQESIERLKGQFTIIAVAHRLSTVIHADRIVVLEEGRMVQCGPPDELLNTPGPFLGLYEHQYRSAV